MALVPIVRFGSSFPERVRVQGTMELKPVGKLVFHHRSESSS